MEAYEEDFFDELKQTLPPLVPRIEIERYLPGVLNKRYLANLDSEGKGPRAARIGRRVVYRRDDLINWLAQRTTV